MEKINKKDLITDAAMSCFLDSGYRRTSMDDIVKVSGISKGGIYWYFNSKEEIFLYFLERELDKEQEKHRKISQSSSSAQEQLHQFFQAHLEHDEKFPLHLVVGEFLTQLKNPEITRSFQKLIQKKHHKKNFFIQALELGIKNQEFIPHNTQIMAEVICAVCEGCTFRYVMEHQNTRLLQEALEQAEVMVLAKILKTGGI
ncbi:MAG: TetR/AcrR family transcriptional regulator [Clostridia bacterium]|nr:TetR/AcrR family transcriptional regulator [Clostridia bacterium]